MTQKAAKTLYDHPSKPLMPKEGAALALELIRSAERLGSSLHPITRAAVADLVRSMNSYYSNLIEGHRTTPRDSDAALRKVLSARPQNRAAVLWRIPGVSEHRLAPHKRSPENCSRNAWSSLIPRKVRCDSAFRPMPPQVFSRIYILREQNKVE